MDSPGTRMLAGLNPSELQEVVIGCALLAIEEDFLGPYDLTEFHSGIGIMRVKIRMCPLDRAAECGSQALGVVARQRAEQIVKRIHARPAVGLSCLPPKMAAANS